MTVIAIFSIFFNIYQFISKRPKFKFRMCYDIEPNQNGVGNFLCARLFVSNIGGQSATYNGLEGVDESGEIFYPCCSIEPGSKIEPYSSVFGHIPNGHLLTHGTKKLLIVDGVLKKHKVPKNILKNLLAELQQEKERLEKQGLNVHPPNLFERHNNAN